MNGYSASRAYFNWAIGHPREASTSMGLLYLYLVEICNRLGWRDTFGITSGECRSAISVSSYNTYQDALHRLVEFGFVEIVERAKNQYSPTIIRLIKKEDQDPEHVASSNFGYANFGYANFERANEEASEDISDASSVGTSVGISVGTSVGISKNDNATETFINNKHKTININNNNNIDYADCEIYDEFRDFEKWILDNAPNVAKMKEPFTRPQFEKLFAEFDPDLIYEKLGAMHNYTPLLTKCRSANLTIRNWLRRDSARPDAKTKRNPKPSPRIQPTMGGETVQQSKLSAALEAVAGALIE